MGVVLIGGVVWLGFWVTNLKPVTESGSDAAKNIFFDAKWYEVLWMRWTAVDWILSLLAAGTAIAAGGAECLLTSCAGPGAANSRRCSGWGRKVATSDKTDGAGAQ
jgi:hypothetical protein